MDWVQVFVILGVTLGGFFYLANRIDNVNKDLSEKIQKNREEIQKNREEIQKNREQILWIKFRLDPYEHPQWEKLQEKKEKK